MHCIQCGLEFNEYNLCPECKQSPVCLYDISKEHNIWYFCWNCGNHLEDDEEKCSQCRKKREEYVNHLIYFNCPTCKKDIDPIFDCPYCNDFVEPIKLKYTRGDWEFINKQDCPFPLMYGDYKHDNKNKLNYKRDKNGLYSVSTLPIVNIIMRYRGETVRRDIANDIKDFFGFKRLNQKRINKLKSIMPKKIFVEYDTKGKRQLSQKDLNNWFSKYK